MPSCEHCLMGKKKKMKPFGKANRASFPFQLVHSNICCPMKLRGQGMVNPTSSHFINDYTRYSHIYLISHKSKAFNWFRHYMNLVEYQLAKSIKALKIYSECEYLFEQFKALYKEKWIKTNHRNWYDKSY